MFVSIPVASATTLDLKNLRPNAWAMRTPTEFWYGATLTPHVFTRGYAGHFPTSRYCRRREQAVLFLEAAKNAIATTRRHLRRSKQNARKPLFFSRRGQTIQRIGVQPAP